MKQKLKKIVILWALMVLAGSVFGEDVIRSKRVGQYEISVEYFNSFYTVIIRDYNDSAMYVTFFSRNKSDAMEKYREASQFNSAQVKGLLAYIGLQCGWSYMGESYDGFSMYNRQY